MYCMKNLHLALWNTDNMTLPYTTVHCNTTFTVQKPRTDNQILSTQHRVEIECFGLISVLVLKFHTVEIA